METRSFTAYYVVIGLLAAASLVLAFSVNVSVTDEAGVKMALPDQVGEWSGQDIRFCLNPVCQRDWFLADITNGVCPACGGDVSTMTKAEKDLLPADTILLKKQYKTPSGQSLFVSIVLSGSERASIHRPQICLVGQGNEIVDSNVLPVDLPGRDPVEVMVLDLIRRAQDSGGVQREMPTYYAYWFVGKGRETPYHIQRMIWMATDRILHNVSHKWAYIAVAGVRKPGDDAAYKQQIAGFVRDLYPQLLADGT